MASHFQYHPMVSEVVPYNAKFQFPSQATRTAKTTVKIPPKNGRAYYGPGDVIRFEFPATGYINPLSTLLSLKAFLNVQLPVANVASAGVTLQNGRIQNNINSCFSRIRFMYGSLPIEDFSQYGLLNRILTEAGVGRDYMNSLGALSNIGDAYSRAFWMAGAGGSTKSDPDSTLNIQSFYPGNIASTTTSAAPTFDKKDPLQAGKRFVTPFLLGLMQQRKLLPTKWGSSQFAIELQVDQAQNFVIFDGITQTSAATLRPAYSGAPVVAGFYDLNILADIYEFDSSYDEAFYDALSDSGVPIQFQSWHYSSFTMSGSATTAQIQERARSVKMALACVTAAQSNYTADSHVTFSVVNPALQDNCGKLLTANANTEAQAVVVANNVPTMSGIYEYQFRIGGKYFPAQPVEVHTKEYSIMTAGGAEALFELQKCLDIVGAFQTGAGFVGNTWCNQYAQIAVTTNATATANAIQSIAQGNRDISVPYSDSGLINAASDDTIVIQETFKARRNPLLQGNSFFVMGADFETSNGLELAGINAEEQSDVMLFIKNAGTANSNMLLNVFIAYDALLIIRENNQVDWIS